MLKVAEEIPSPKQLASDSPVLKISISLKSPMSQPVKPFL